MIKRSRRRSPPRQDPLSVHLGMARARQWQRRLWLGSACACAASLLLWLAGAGLVVHLGVTVAAFAAGLAWPVRSARDWALAWVSGHGLSYPTAVELAHGGADPHTADPYGFHAAVAQRAGAQAAKLEPPKPQPWYLPLLVTALILAVLPVSPFGGRGAPFAATRPSSTATPPPDAGSNGAADPAAEAEAPEDPQNGGGPEAGAAQDTPTAPTLDDLSAAGDAAGAGSSTSDAEALDRFLETLRDPPPPREQPNPFSSAAPSRRSGAPGEQELGEREPGEQGQGEQEAGDASDGQNTAGQDGDSSGAEPSDAGEQGEQGQGEQAQGEQGQGEQAQGEQSQGEQAEEGQGEQGQGDESGPTEAQSEQEQPGEGAGENEAQSAQQSDAEGSGAQQGAPGDEAGSPDAGESGEGVGDAPGGLSLSDNNRLDNPGQDPEQLRGRLNSGPSNVAGTVRLQGSPAEAQPAAGSAPGGFSRAEEQAITEGRIPVEYQDIIRNYFR